MRDHDWQTPSLKRAWRTAILTPEIAALDVRELKARAEPVLFAIERAGMESFNAATWMQHEQIADALGELGTVGITLGFSSPALAGSSGSLKVDLMDGGDVGGDGVSPAVEAEAADAGNRRKLAQLPDAAGRHLAVFIHPSQTRASYSSSHGEPLSLTESANSRSISVHFVSRSVLSLAD